LHKQGPSVLSGVCPARGTSLFLAQELTNGMSRANKVIHAIDKTAYGLYPYAYGRRGGIFRGDIMLTPPTTLTPIFPVPRLGTNKLRSLLLLPNLSPPCPLKRRDLPACRC
jgi:hypothetical protein